MFDKIIFEDMKNIALEILQGMEKKEYAQAIVLKTAAGNKYSAFIENALSKEKTDEKALLEKLSMAKDTKIDFILCFWQEGELDLPSFDFRKMLLDLDGENSDSEIFVMTGSGVSAVKLEKTMR